MIKIYKSVEEPVTIVREASQFELLNYEKTFCKAIRQQALFGQNIEAPKTVFSGPIFKSREMADPSVDDNIFIRCDNK